MSGAGIYTMTPGGLVAAATVPGKQGSQGQSPTIAVGTVTTGAPGTNASATITGTTPALTMNLTIPRGNVGNPTEFELRGTGMPEGVVTAPVGTYYTDSAGTNGAWRWLKKTGTGNTGWTVESGDTGWRNSFITSTATIIASELAVRRIGGVVYLNYASPTNPGAGTQDIWNPIPTGFRHAISSGGSGVPIHRDGIAAGNVFLQNATWVRMNVAAAGTWVRFGMNWPTNDAWPTTLPGTAV